MTREYARAPRGERAQGAIPRNVGTVTTMIGALDVTGVRAMMTVEGATDGEAFETFIERVLLRQLKPGDNVGAQEAAEVRRLIRAADARVLFLPPYSPDLDHIELCWSKLKALLREFGARPRDALDDAIRRAMDLIDGADASAWFGHCGYSGQLQDSGISAWRPRAYQPTTGRARTSYQSYSATCRRRPSGRRTSHFESLPEG